MRLNIVIGLGHGSTFKSKFRQLSFMVYVLLI